MTITKDTIISELVVSDYRSATVFKQNSIDFCCNGNKSIGDACAQKNLDADDLILQLNKAAQQQNSGVIDYNSWPIDLLADYIEKKHHRYVAQKIEEIVPFLHKVVRVHGGRHPELLEIWQLFQESAEELTDHMSKEEGILFPYIRKMVQAQQNGDAVQVPFGTVQNPIRMMMQEHDTEGGRFRQISALSNAYTPPDDGCSTYRVTFALLKEFEDDLHLHIHLENNILFPKAIVMEKAFEPVVSTPQ